MRLAFLGTPDFAVPSLRALSRAGHDIAVVVTNPDRPKGRSGEPAPPPVKVAALELGLPVYQPVDTRSDELPSRLRADKVELGVVVAYGAYLVKKVREAPSRGFMINLHASLLPRWRGAAPIAAAVRAGDRVSGVSIQKVEKELDGGPVCASREETIRPDDTRATLELRLSAIGAELLGETVPRIERGEAVFTPQDHSLATHAREIQKEEGRIDWGWPSAQLERLVRAMQPWPVAFFEHEKKRVLVLKTGLADVSGAPGHVLAVQGDALVVGTGAGAIALLEVRPEGKNAMSASAWARGRRLGPGSVL